MFDPYSLANVLQKIDFAWVQVGRGAWKRFSDGEITASDVVDTAVDITQLVVSSVLPSGAGNVISNVVDKIGDVVKRWVGAGGEPGPNPDDVARATANKYPAPDWLFNDDGEMYAIVSHPTFPRLDGEHVATYFNVHGGSGKGTYLRLLDGQTGRELHRSKISSEVDQLHRFNFDASDSASRVIDVDPYSMDPPVVDLKSAFGIALTFVGDRAFSGSGNPEARYYEVPEPRYRETVLEVDLKGNAEASIIIRFRGGANLAADGHARPGHDIEIKGAYLADELPAQEEAGSTINTSGDMSASVGDDYIQTSDESGEVSGSFGDDTIVGGKGDDVIYGNQGLDAVAAGDGNDTIFGGQNAGTPKLDAYGHLRMQDGIETINGGAGDDVVYGNFGTETINGGSGKDELFGGQNNDTLFGGSGNDTLVGGRGDDVLTGGSGADEFIFGPDFGNDVIADFDFGQEDRLVLDSPASFSVDQIGNDVVISDQVDGSQIRLIGVSLGSEMNVYDFL